MGNTDSIDINQEIYDWRKQVKPKIDKSLYGNANLVVEGNHVKITKTKNIEDQQTMKIVKNYLDTDVIKSGIFTTRKAEISKSRNKFCGTCSCNTQLRIEFDYYPRDLFNEILQRCKLNDYYNEAEIWFIIKSIAKMEWILTKRLKIGHHRSLSTKSIFISDDGEIKFLDPFLLETTHSPYSQNLLRLSKNPLPPELCDALKNYKPEPEVNEEKVEVWMIGLVILCVSTLANFEIFYNFGNFSLNEQIIDTMMKKVGRDYSPLLRDLLKLCLRFKPEERCNMETINNFLAIRDGQGRYNT